MKIINSLKTLKQMNLTLTKLVCLDINDSETESDSDDDFM